MVLLLGTLGGAVNSHIIIPESPEISWSQDNVLNLALPLGSSLLNICLGNYLQFSRVPLILIFIKILMLSLDLVLSTLEKIG